MRTPRRARTHTKTLDVIKAAITILGLLILIVVILWAGTRMMQPKENEHDYMPRPAKSLWEEPPPAR